jgi:hypothetical protein
MLERSSVAPPEGVLEIIAERAENALCLWGWINMGKKF